MMELIRGEIKVTRAKYPPKHLDSEAKAFWTKHAGRLGQSGVLNDSTEDSFAVLARVWSEMLSLTPEKQDLDSKAAVRYMALLKQYQPLAVKFGLLPAKPPAPEKKKSIQDVVKGNQ